MVTQTTVGRRSEYHGESFIYSRQRVVHLPVKTGVIPHRDYNNIPAPAVVDKQIRIGMPRSLLKSLKIADKRRSRTILSE